MSFAFCVYWSGTIGFQPKFNWGKTVIFFFAEMSFHQYSKCGVYESNYFPYKTPNKYGDGGSPTDKGRHMETWECIDASEIIVILPI